MCSRRFKTNPVSALQWDWLKRLNRLASRQIMRLAQRFMGSLVRYSWLRQKKFSLKRTNDVRMRVLFSPTTGWVDYFITALRSLSRFRLLNEHSDRMIASIVRKQWPIVFGIRHIIASSLWIWRIFVFCLRKFLDSLLCKHSNLNGQHKFNEACASLFHISQKICSKRTAMVTCEPFGYCFRNHVLACFHAIAPLLLLLVGIILT